MPGTMPMILGMPGGFGVRRTLRDCAGREARVGGCLRAKLGYNAPCSCYRVAIFLGPKDVCSGQKVRTR